MGKWLALLALAVQLGIAGTVEFSGTPSRKVEIDEKGEGAYKLTEEEKGKYQVVITKEGEKYFWTSRGGLEMVRTESGSYLTYVAINGSGYVRTLQPWVRDMHAKLSEKEKREAGFLYLEHLVHRMGSITYFGF
jgi:hypothetical protein